MIAYFPYFDFILFNSSIKSSLSLSVVVKSLSIKSPVKNTISGLIRFISFTICFNLFLLVTRK